MNLLKSFFDLSGLRFGTSAALAFLVSGVMILGLAYAAGTVITWAPGQAPQASPNMGNVVLANPSSPYGYHTDDCNTATEGFVAMTNNGLGLCFEKTERSASTWEAAWQTCINAGYRLPDYMEWKKACNGAAGAGLSGMTNGDEWASSTPHAVIQHNFYGGAVSLTGGGAYGCGPHVGWAQGGRSYFYSATFRCVR